MGINDHVHLAAHDRGWPALAAAEIARLESLAAPTPFAVHHIGSTAVPGLTAKPIVDLMAVAPSLEAVDALRPAIEAAGYRWHGEYGVAGRRFCAFDDPVTGIRTFHLHAFGEGHSAIREHLAFRDRLRADPALAAAYEAEKRRCASLHADDRPGYTACKAAWVRKTIDALFAAGQ